MHHVYDLFLRLLPEDFRRRYGVEMALDFADGWREAATGGWRRRVEFAMRASGDLAMTLFREWTRGARLGVVAATASVTALLWGLALRPWSWPWQTSPSPRHAAVVPVTEAELLVLAGTAMLPVLVLLLFARRLVQRQDCGRRVSVDWQFESLHTTPYANNGTETAHQPAFGPVIGNLRQATPAR